MAIALLLTSKNVCKPADYSLFSTYEQFATLAGVVRRVTDLMYVLEELRPRPGSAAEQQAEHALVAPNSGAFSPHGKRVTGDATGLVLQGCDIVTPAISQPRMSQSATNQKNRVRTTPMATNFVPSGCIFGNW